MKSAGKRESTFHKQAKKSGDNEKKRLRFKLCYTLFLGTVMLVLLVLCTRISFGWLAQNKNTSASGMQIGVETGSGQVSAAIEVYRYDVNADKATNRHLDGEKAGEMLTLSEGLTLNPYDVIFESRNRYTPVFAKITLSNIGSLQTDEGTIAVTVKRNENSGAETAADGTELSCSTVMRFSVDTLAAQLKISKKTVYKLFPDKETLALAMYEKFYDEAKLREILKLYDPILHLSLVIVIVNLGMQLDYRLIAGAGLFTVIYILSRAIGRIGGSYLGGKLTHAEPTVTRYLGLTLLPHSGVSLVFTGIAATTLSSIDPSLAALVSGTIVAAAIINEIIAVIVAKYAFKRAGEITDR